MNFIGAILLVVSFGNDIGFGRFESELVGGIRLVWLGLKFADRR